MSKNDFLMIIKLFIPINGIFLLFALIALESCGLPDVTPQINKPSIKTISTNIYTLYSSDVKPDGKPYSIYGLAIYYKIYKRSDGITKFSTDFTTVNNSSSNPDTVLVQNGFNRLAKSGTNGNSDTSLPSFGFETSSLWNVTMDFSTGSKSTLDIELSTVITNACTHFYRFISPQTIKKFLISELDKTADSDLSLLRSDPGFNPTDTCFGIICYVYAQDYDWSYLPLFSAPIALGTFDIL